MTINNRLRLFVKHLGLSERKFAFKTGLSEGALGRSNSLNGEGLAKIKKQYPELNMHWVFFGEGDMVMPPEMVKEQSGEYKMTYTIDSLVDIKVNQKCIEIFDEKFGNLKELIKEIIATEIETELENAKSGLDKKENGKPNHG